MASFSLCLEKFDEIAFSSNRLTALVEEIWRLNYMQLWCDDTHSGCKEREQIDIENVAGQVRECEQVQSQGYEWCGQNLFN